MDEKQRLSMQRRLRFGLIVIVSQILLVALAISWLVHMSIIAISGSVYFVENNPIILWIEISLTILITMFGIHILIVQIKRLGERRGGERSSDISRVVIGDRRQDRNSREPQSVVAKTSFER